MNNEDGDQLVSSQQIEILDKLFDSEIKTDEDYLALAEIFDEEE